jgi:tungstate transport system substrate-binding protein
MASKIRLTTYLLALVVFGLLASCSDRQPGVTNEPKATSKGAIRVATTTSTDNTGLLEVLLPKFAAKTGIEVQVIAVGTGRAIKHGENGDVDLILVHARAAEDKFVKDGFGINRRNVMHNDFVIIGPAEDPAGIKGTGDVLEALKKIAGTGSMFVSRGDDSGTHKKEKSLWQAAGIEPSGEWYMSAGQGMGVVIIIADEKQAYTMTDRGTYIAYKSKIEIPVLVEGDKRLFNPYGVIAVNPEKHPHVKYAEAMKFIEWLTSEEAQKLIGSFKKDGETLFHPDALPEK